MKALFVLVLTLLFTNVEAQLLYPSGVPNCIARYDFSTSQSTITNLPDVSGNGNNSSAVQNLIATTSWRNLANKAMKFNGSSSYAQIPNNSILMPSAVTMVALVKLDGFYNGNCQFSQIMIKGYPAYIPGQYALAIGDHVYDNNCYNFDTAHQQLVGYFNNGYTAPGMTPNAGNYINTGKWYMVAVSFDGDNMRYYQEQMNPNVHNNNVAAIFSSSNVGSPIGTNLDDITIGRTFNPPYPYWFNGAMDEVALFNKTLSITEMQSVYDFLWGVLTIDASIDTNLCPGGSVMLPFSINAANAFQSGNVITAQLSDAGGDFTTPVTIGSTISTVSGTINCTIPAGTPLGAGYKIRLAASIPFEYSEVFPANFSVAGTTGTPTVSLSVSPAANVGAGQLVTFTATTTNAGVAPTFQWKKNNVIVPGVTTATYSTTDIANNDVVSVIVLSSNSCSNPKTGESSPITMTVTPTSIHNVADFIDHFSLFPNPNNGNLTITGNTRNNNSLYLEVRNVLGQKVYAENIVPKNGTIKHNIIIPSQMPAGIYLLEITQSSAKMVKTFVVTKDKQ